MWEFIYHLKILLKLSHFNFIYICGLCVLSLKNLKKNTLKVWSVWIVSSFKIFALFNLFVLLHMALSSFLYLFSSSLWIRARIKERKKSCIMHFHSKVISRMLFYLFSVWPILDCFGTNLWLFYYSAVGQIHLNHTLDDYLL